MSSSPTTQPVSGSQAGLTELENWIDYSATARERVGEVVTKLTAWTLPREPWKPGEFVNPLRGDLDSQFWFWNRAANRFIDRGHFDAAREVWSAHYLACLSLQNAYRHRFDKSMPLCNMGFAFVREGRWRLAIKCWYLGLIEDALTDAPGAHDALNYLNLRKMRVPTTVLDQLITAVESRFVRQAITPWLPELVIEPWLNPTSLAPSEDCLKSVDKLSRLLDQSYPGLPDPAAPWENTLAPCWSFADWARGVVDG